MFSACFSVVDCPSCGEALPVADVVFPEEPMLTVVTCEGCGRKVEARKDLASGELVAKVEKKN